MYLHFVQIGAKLAESFFLIPFCSWLLARFSLLFVWVVSSATDENKHLYFLRKQRFCCAAFLFTYVSIPLSQKLLNPLINFRLIWEKADISKTVVFLQVAQEGKTQIRN